MNSERRLSKLKNDFSTIGLRRQGKEKSLFYFEFNEIEWKNLNDVITINCSGIIYNFVFCANTKFIIIYLIKMCYKIS